MLAQSLVELHTSLQRQGIVFTYDGYLTDSLLTAFGAVVREKLRQEGIANRRARDLFAVFIEQGQNILRYSIDRGPDGDGEMANGTLLIAREDDLFVVAAGNPIPDDAVERLRTRLTELAALDADALKQAYKERLRAPQEATSKGAGVGFMEMARRSDSGVQFEFSKHDEAAAFFAVSVSL